MQGRKDYFCQTGVLNRSGFSVEKLLAQNVKVYRQLADYVRPSYPVVTVGAFDGVHLGHRKILERLRQVADNTGGSVVVLTFHPHPRKVISGRDSDFEMLNTPAEKAALLEAAGVDVLVVQPFTLEFSRMEYDAFVRQVLIDSLGVNTLVIGYDHQFGFGRKGGMDALRQLAPEWGFEVEEIPKQDIEAVAISSTRIRRALHAGEVELARQLLGYRYSLDGTVVEGRKLGRTLGYPTANIRVDDPDKLVPMNGVYAVSVEWEGQSWIGALNIGNRPTFDHGARSIEVHLLDFSGDLYGQQLRIRFASLIRHEMKFDSVENLAEQLGKDCGRCRELFASE